MKTEKVLLGDIAEFIRGINFKPDDVVAVGTPESVVCMRTKNVQAEIDLYDIWAVNKSFVKREKQLLQAGDILVSSANSWNLVGKCCWIPELPWKASFGGFVTVLRPQKEKVNQNFLYRWFASDRVQALLRSFGQKTTNISNLNIDRCLKLELYLPPIAEQKRIAEILDRTQSLISKRKEAIVKLDTLIQSIFIEMFGDPVANPFKLPFLSLENVVSKSFQNGAYFPKEAYCSKGGVEMIHMSDAFEGIVKRGNLKRVDCSQQDIERYKISDTDLIVARRSLNYEGSVKPCLIPASTEPLIFESSLIRITPNPEKALVIYLFYYILNPRVRERFIFPFVTKSTISGINQGNLAKVLVMIPPINLQKEFAQRVETVEKLKATHRASLSHLQALFASLQHRAFRGEL